MHLIVSNVVSRRPKKPDPKIFKMFFRYLIIAALQRATSLLDIGQNIPCCG